MRVSRLVALIIVLVAGFSQVGRAAEAVGFPTNPLTIMRAAGLHYPHRFQPY
jgi:hypothetical protein